ncbi:MAG: rod shape-determining protein [Candidatus Buchananbacteria bacterium]
MYNPFSKLLTKFNKSIGIDLGTSNTLIYLRDRGIVANESSVVAINNRTNQIVAVGEEARKMLGKTPPHIVASKPLIDGVVSDFETTEKMLQYFMNKVQRQSSFFSPRPRVIVGIPLDITEVEKKAVEDAVLSAGAKEVKLVESIMAAAIGARVPIQDPTGNMIVNIGGGLTEIAVISLGGIVNWRSLKLAGEELDRDIIKYAREEFNLLLGERVAEEIKIKVGSAHPLEKPLDYRMRGRDLLSGLPREVIVTDGQIREALSRTIKTILENIRTTLETTPPELIADILQKGIILTGGSSLLHGLERYLAIGTQIPVQVADDAITCTVRGLGTILENESLLKEIALPSTQGA